MNQSMTDPFIFNPLIINPKTINLLIIFHGEIVRFWPGVSRLSGLVQSRLHYDSLWWGYYLQWSNFSSCENSSWKLEKRKEESRKNFVYPGTPNSSTKICFRILSIPTWTVCPQDWWVFATSACGQKIGWFQFEINLTLDPLPGLLGAIAGCIG